MRLESLNEMLTLFPDMDGYWDLDNLDSTEMQIRQRLTSTNGTRSQFEAENLIQMARLLALKKDFAGAKSHLMAAHEILSLLDPQDRAKLEVRYLLEQGRLLVHQMSLANSQTYFNQAWVLAIKTNQAFYAIDSALMLALSQPPKFQKEWLQKAFDLAHSTSDSQARHWLPYLRLLMAWRSFDLHRFEEAFEHFENALVGPHYPNSQKMILLIRWGMARTLRALRQPARALEIQRELLNETLSTSTASGYVHLEIGECLQALQNFSEAKAHFETAHEILSADKWYADNCVDELLRMQHLSKDHF